MNLHARSLCNANVALMGHWRTACCRAACPFRTNTRKVKALPNLAEAASSSELKQAFQTHLTETEMHVARLEQIFEFFGQDPDADTSDSVKGIVKDGDNAIDLDADPSLRDAALIAAGCYCFLATKTIWPAAAR